MTRKEMLIGFCKSRMGERQWNVSSGYELRAIDKYLANLKKTKRMVEISRKLFKKDPVFKKLYETIKQYHVVAEHTKKVLIENEHIKDFCEEAIHFVVLQGTPQIFLHYEVYSWYKNKQIPVKIVSIGIYDDFMEYEKARLSGLHSEKDSNIPNIN